ncbi:MAG: DUF2007 domain-containing protein [Chthoniobacteraceae bacterium]
MVKDVLRDCDQTRVDLRRSVLESAGVRCFVRNEATHSAIVGGLMVAFFPLPDFFPTLCIVDDEQYEAAMELLRG